MNKAYREMKRPVKTVSDRQTRLRSSFFLNTLSTFKVMVKLGDTNKSMDTFDGQNFAALDPENRARSIK